MIAVEQEEINCATWGLFAEKGRVSDDGLLDGDVHDQIMNASRYLLTAQKSVTTDA